MSNEYYVYGYHDPVTGVPFYVGKGREDRCFDHIDNARYFRTEDKFPYGYNRHLHYKICQLRELGFEPLIVKWNVDLEEDQAFLLEKIFIKLIGRRNIGTGSLVNLTDGGEGVSGRVPWNKGVSPSAEITNRISTTLIGYYRENPVTEETKQSISEGVLEWTHSEEGQQWIRENAKARVGIPRTEEARRKQSEGMKLAWRRRRTQQQLGENANV